MRVDSKFLPYQVTSLIHQHAHSEVFFAFRSPLVQNYLVCPRSILLISRFKISCCRLALLITSSFWISELKVFLVHLSPLFFQILEQIILLFLCQYREQFSMRVKGVQITEYVVTLADSFLLNEDNCVLLMQSTITHQVFQLIVPLLNRVWDLSGVQLKQLKFTQVNRQQDHLVSAGAFKSHDQSRCWLLYKRSVNLYDTVRQMVK